MGYYINIQESEFLIPTENLDKALERFKALNHDPNAVKGGGSWSSGEENERWFSWMPSDYDQTVTSAQEVLDLLGFDTWADERGVHIHGYDNKIGDETQFLNAIRDLVDVSCYIIWRGEDGEFWKWTPRGVLEGRITFHELS
jgi:hypothetical protein